MFVWIFGWCDPHHDPKESHVVIAKKTSTTPQIIGITICHSTTLTVATKHFFDHR
jgi:hypothetical protein